MTLNNSGRFARRYSCAKAEFAFAATSGNGRGIGLRNTRERLKVLYGDAHRFEVADVAPGLRVEMHLPLEV